MGWPGLETTLKIIYFQISCSGQVHAIIDDAEALLLNILLLKYRRLFWGCCARPAEAVWEGCQLPSPPQAWVTESQILLTAVLSCVNEAVLCSSEEAAGFKTPGGKVSPALCLPRAVVLQHCSYLGLVSKSQILNTCIKQTFFFLSIALSYLGSGNSCPKAKFSFHLPDVTW